MKENRYIVIENARLHNLQNVTVKIPLGKITLVSGVSGSGKSSLAVDLLGNLSRQKYIDLLGEDFALRRRLVVGEEDFVDNINPVCPGIIFKGRVPQRNPKSTVATVSGIGTHLRNLYRICGKYSCPQCGASINVKQPDEIVSWMLENFKARAVILKAPLILSSKKDKVQALLRQLLSSGFLRFEIDGKLFFLDEDMDILLKRLDSLCEVNLVIDRFRLSPEKSTRLFDGLRTAFSVGNGRVSCDIEDECCQFVTHHFSTRLWCQRCRIFLSDGTGPVTGDGNILNATLTLAGKDVQELHQASLSYLHSFLKKLREDNKLYPGRWMDRVVRRILSYLECIEQLGIDYLHLFTPVTEISSGEFLKLRFARLISQQLTGALFVLDEPIGFLPAFERKAICLLIKQLKELGNTIVVIDHCMEAAQISDYLVEMGPEGGTKGGKIIYQGWIKSDRIEDFSLSKEGVFYHDNRQRSEGNDRYLSITLSDYFKSCRSLKIRAGCLTVVCGPTGSGKSRLLSETYKWLKKYYASKAKVVFVPSGEIFRSRYSITATALSVFSSIRTLFSRTPEARGAGLTANMFSLARKGGRCEVCKGTGEVIREGFGFIVSYVCPVCKGTRYNADMLDIRYKGYNIKDVLDLTCIEAADLFARISTIRKPLEFAERAGIGYLRLGQVLEQISTGEAQRLKIASQLSSSKTDRHNIFLLDQPTGALHPKDVEDMVKFFQELLNWGVTLIVAENNPFIVEMANNLIRLKGAGPTGGLLELVK